MKAEHVSVTALLQTEKYIFRRLFTLWVPLTPHVCKLQTFKCSNCLPYAMVKGLKSQVFHVFVIPMFESQRNILIRLEFGQRIWVKRNVGSVEGFHIVQRLKRKTIEYLEPFKF